jgi:hypothetical protein
LARIRTIKPEFWTHEDLSALPEATHMLAAALLNHADDEGYFNANPGLVRAACSPLREPSVSIHDSLNLLRKAGFIRVGVGSDGKRYGLIVTFDSHQRINRPTASKIKLIGIVWEDSQQPHPQLTEDSPPERNREGNGKEQGKDIIGSPTGESTKTEKPICLTNAKAERLSQVTTEAVEAFNAILGKPNGKLASVQLTNEVRQNQIKRCLQTARQICERQYGSSTITAKFWQEYFAECNRDPFKRGDGPYSGAHENWRPDFEYLTRNEVMTALFDKAMSEAAA